MSDEMMMYLLYFVYYVLFPLGLIIPILIIWRKKDFITGISKFGEGREDRSSPMLRKHMGDIKKLQVFLVVFLLIFLPVMNFTFSDLSDITMSRDRRYFGGLGRSRVYDPVRRQIGPYRDTDAVLEEMRQNPDDWYLEDIEEQLDFDEITRIPGEMAVYFLDKRDSRHIVITYTYLSPIPISRVYGFWVYDMIEDERASLEKQETVIYPMNPANTDPF